MLSIMRSLSGCSLAGSLWRPRKTRRRVDSESGGELIRTSRDRVPVVVETDIDREKLEARAAPGQVRDRASRRRPAGAARHIRLEQNCRGVVAFGVDHLDAVSTSLL